MSVTPCGIFRVWSPDEVAECFSGVSKELYRTLWTLTRELPEDTSEVPDNFEERCLVKVWDKLSDTDQEELNRLARANGHT